MWSLGNIEMGIKYTLQKLILKSKNKTPAYICFTIFAACLFYRLTEDPGPCLLFSLQ